MGSHGNDSKNIFFKNFILIAVCKWIRVGWGQGDWKLRDQLGCYFSDPKIKCEGQYDVPPRSLFRDRELMPSTAGSATRRWTSAVSFL